MASNESYYIKYLNEVSIEISYYYLMITLPLGILGNLISLYIYTRPNLNRKTNTGFLYAWLCVFNLLSILQYAFLTRSSILFNFTINLPCGMVDFLRRTIYKWLSWMQVYISFDRFVAVYFPSKTSFMSKKIVHYLAMIGILAFVLVTNITNLITWPVPIVVNNTVTYSCYISDGIYVATSIIALLIRVFIPYTLMAFFNGLVISRLKKSKIKFRMVFTNRTNSTRRQMRKEYKFIQATLLMDFIFLLMHMPSAVAWLTMSIIYQLTDNSLPSNPLSNAIFRFYLNIAQLIAFSYSMAGIFMFTKFNRNFREELIDLLKLRRFLGQRVDNSITIDYNTNNNMRTILY